MSAADQTTTAAASIAALRVRLHKFRDGDLAKASGVSRSNIRLIKAGMTTNPGVVTVEQLTKALNALESAPPRKRPTRQQKARPGKAPADA